jgi:DNA (cytosine-5)-methyltransferase 1
MEAMNYYNENNPFAANWLRDLIQRGLIPHGFVDERSIRDVTADNIPLDGYRHLLDFDQCHFFAGIGGWSYALELAGWPNDRAVWTGSCPCQPFSVAGKRKGVDDERHLWPEMYRLIAECKPPVIFGEQVGRQDGYQWVARVYADLEAAGYRVPKDEHGNYEAYDLPAACVAAPHIRQRLWWLADADQDGRQTWHMPHDRMEATERSEQVVYAEFNGCPSPGRLADAEDADRRRAGGAEDSGRRGEEARRPSHAGHWGGGGFVSCRDSKVRRIEPGSFPLAHGIPGRVGLLHGYGNAIVPQVAAEFITAYMEEICVSGRSCTATGDTSSAA